MFGKTAIKVVIFFIGTVSIGGLISGCYSLAQKRTLKDVLESEGYMLLSYSNSGSDRKHWIQKSSEYNKEVVSLLGKNNMTEDKLRKICSSLLKTFELDENFDVKAATAKSWCVKA